jgi:uncharacterized protein YoxC
LELPGPNSRRTDKQSTVASEQIEHEGADEVGEREAELTDYVRRLQYLQTNTIPQIWGGNNAPATTAYLFTLDGLREALAPVLTREPHREAIASVRKLTNQIRTLEARLSDLAPRTESIQQKVDTIERAYDAADQLPTDLQALEEAKQKIDRFVDDATQNQVRLEDIRGRADGIERQLKDNAKEAASVLERSRTAYAAATSVGLAAAFSERSDRLSTSMWFWVAGLIAALASGFVFGGHRIQVLVELFKEPNPSPAAIYPNVVLSLLSVGAPIWFAWLSTKQIGQRFRLSEDYAFKASVARAYEGFRREAARIDTDLEARLLTSAISRLDELPLRLVETETHGSPWQELANNELLKEAVRSVPNFTTHLRDFAEKAIAGAKSVKITATPTPKAPTDGPAA